MLRILLPVILALVGTMFSLLFLVPAVAGLFRFAVLDVGSVVAVSVMATGLVALLFAVKGRYASGFTR